MNTKKLIIVSCASALLVSLSLIFAYSDILENPPPKNQTPRAVIIDQLHNDVPSDYFHRTATNHLKKLGYEVDNYTTENATVNFFRNLPSMNYDFIVFRGHAVSAEEENNSVMIFTGEKYSEDKYAFEQLFGQIKKGTPLLERTFSIDKENNTGWVYVNGSKNIKMITSHVQTLDQPHEEFFLFNSKSVNDLMKGRFNDSVILLGGCSTLKNDSLAKSFVEKGASQIVGWTDLVTSSENDRALLQILETMANDGLTVNEATNKVKEALGSNLKYNAKLEFFS